ncbi:MAG: PfkB family carbohydrate kinase [Aliishimia sp.]
MSATVFNLGSINRDKTIKVPRFPRPGETIAGQEASACLGGKGLNISLALHRAGQSVSHIGAVHKDDADTVNEIEVFGLKADAIERSSHMTGEAYVLLDDDRENAIVLCPGANMEISRNHIDQCFITAKSGDWLVLQNETNNQHYAVGKARAKGMTVGLVAAPFDAEVVGSLSGDLDLLVLNEIEAAQLEQAKSTSISNIGIPLVVVTKGAAGATLYRNGLPLHIASLPVKPIDTTAAGDTFFGFFLSAVLAGLSDNDALRRANAAAALSVQTYGAAHSIPTLRDVQDFLKGYPNEDNS